MSDVLVWLFRLSSLLFLRDFGLLFDLMVLYIRVIVNLISLLPFSVGKASELIPPLSKFKSGSSSLNLF
jgi:hypothetical protein